MSEPATDIELILSARAGDQAALEALMKRHKSLVKMRARPYFLIGADRDDLIQEGMIGLFKAVRDFDPELNVSFRAFAEMCITRQLITAIKTASRQKHIPLNSYVSLDGEALLSGRRAADPVETVLAAERVRYVREITEGRLTPLESTVLLAYISGKSYREIAQDLKCGAKAVDNALQRIKRKMAGVAGQLS
ncbi:MAG: RNA polymerase sporulation sigma factor SigH [Actinomycetota bacterium]|nr:RNA polymerase sporulation sigma factor SigH [Actinomycetota bacterium]